MSWSLPTALPPCALISATTSEARRRVAARAVAGDASVVDDDGDAVCGEQQRVLVAEPAPGAGHDRDAPLEFNHDGRRVLRTPRAR